MDNEFLEELDRARGEMNRSAFVREAIWRLLKERGIDLPASIKAAPDRAGKGGRPRKVIEMLAVESSAKVAEEKDDQFKSPPRQKTTYPKGSTRKKTKQ